MKDDYSFRRSLEVEWFDSSNERVYNVHSRIRDRRNRRNDTMRVSDDTDATV